MFLELGLLGSSVLVLVTIVGVLLYLGFFDRVQVDTGKPPINFAGLTLAYKCHRETYSGIGFQFTKQYNLTMVQTPEVRKHLEKANAVGIYYDSPTEKLERCRFLVGLLLTEASDCPEVREALEKDGYRFTVLPDIDHVVTSSFPYRSYTAAYIAFRKVYPVINAYIKERRLCAYPSIEFYTDDYIHFVLPLAKQQDFFYYYKPESDDEEEDEIERAEDNDVDVDRLLNEEEDEYEEEDEIDDVVDEPHQVNEDDRHDQDVEAHDTVYKETESSSRKLRNRSANKICRNNSSSSASSFDELTLEEGAQP